MDSNLQLSYRESFLYVFFLMILMEIPEFFISIINFVFQGLISTKLLFLLNSVLYPVGFLLLFFFLKKAKFPFRLSTDLVKISGLKTYTFILISLVSIIIFISYIIYFLLAQEGFLEKLNKHLEENIKNLSTYKIPFFITAVILAPILEEFFFRGFLLKGLLNKGISPWKSIFFSSFLFGFIHMNPMQILAGFFMGIFIGFVYFQTKSLLNCMLIHCINNAITIWIIFAGKEKQIESYFRQMHWIFPVFALLIALSASFYLSKNKKLELL